MLCEAWMFFTGNPFGRLGDDRGGALKCIEWLHGSFGISNFESPSNWRRSGKKSFKNNWDTCTASILQFSLYVYENDYFCVLPCDCSKSSASEDLNLVGEFNPWMTCLVQADVQAVKEALNSAVDVLNAVEGSVHLLLPKVWLLYYVLAILHKASHIWQCDLWLI